MMKAWQVHRPGPIAGAPLRLVDRPVPETGPDDVLVRVTASAVCRTDLHLAEGDLPPRRPDVTPGHEVVGVVVDRGAEVTGYEPGARVGVAWLRGTCGECVYCRRGAENLCPRSVYTG